jgi:tetratricopeptide (TPR) repeat protein
MVDKLTAKIGLKMGVAPEEKDQELKITDVTTSSLEAYQYYQKGLEHFWRWKFQSAEENFQKAVDIDSAFAMAYLWLAWAQARMGWDLYDPFIDATPFKKTIALAKKYSQKATERERLLIDMGIAFFNFDIESFKTFCKRLVERYPKEKLGYLYLGNAYWFELDYEKAKEAVEKALELDPTYANSYNQLAYMNALLKDRSGATSAVKKYNAVHPDVSLTYHSAWETHAMLGMFDEAQGFLEEGMKRIPEWHSVHIWLGINHLLKQDADKAREEFRIWSDYYPKSIVYSALDMGCSYLLEGKYMMAVSEFRRGVESAQRENDKNNEMLARINLGRILVVQRKYDEAIDEYKEAEKLSMKVYKQDFNPDSIFANYLAGIALVYKGDYKAAQDRADAIKSIMQKGNYKPMNLDFYHLLLGELYTAQKNPKAAQREINKLSGWAKEASPRYKKLVAVINEIQGDFEKAVEEYRNSFENWLLINPTVRRVHLLDFFDERSKVDYNIAKIYEKMGKTTKAMEHYKKFLGLWKDADPGMVEVEDAKKRLAGLKSQ